MLFDRTADRNNGANRRRQWGHDRRPLPSAPTLPPISDVRLTVGRALVVGTVLAWVAYLLTWLSNQFITGGHHTSRNRVEAVVYLITVTLLTASALSYLTCRLGFFYRAREHRRMPRAALESFFSEQTPAVTVIIPSYKEDARTIRTTVLSAALQDYPKLNVVLLIDDPPNPSNRRDRALLDGARAIAPELQALLDGPSKRFAAAYERFAGLGARTRVTRDHIDDLASNFDAAARWMSEQATAQPIDDHVDEFFADQVLMRLATDFAATAEALRAALDDGVVLPRARLLELYRRLVWTFRVELSSFERKQYVSLSHEANKAMNLNSYIGLMGGAYRDTMTVSGRELVPVKPGHGDWEIPEPDYVLTLDADSVLLPEYCLRLVHLMEQSEHADVAVAQTPYSAFPGSGTRLERIAGATTDLQYIAHQGMTYYGATFWVGANAVLRKRALDEVVDSTFVGSWEIKRYIQDRTVIEDTESTIDLRARGWSLLNYPERLAYSATPPDFGSLCIQRRRWANGGLLIMPKLLRTRKQRAARGQQNRFGEIFIRTNYMASVAWSSASLLLLLAYPFSSTLISPLLGAIALPYFFGMASDLKYCGYKRTDVLRIYGLNLILMPVLMAGVCNSLTQALTAQKSAFKRTPKVSRRTVPDFLFVISPYLLTALAGWTLWRNWIHEQWVNFAYASVNTALAAYAVVAFIGLRNSVADILVHARAWLSVPVEPKRRPAGPTVATTVTTNGRTDWASVLHFGHGNTAGSTPPAGPAGAIPAQRPAPTARGWIFAHRPAPDETTTFRTEFEPIVDLSSGETVGREAQTRFDETLGSALQLGDDPARAGGVESEIVLARASVQAAAALPPGEWLGLNVSVPFVRAGRALQVTVTRARRQIVLQLDARSLLDVPDVSRLVAQIPSAAHIAITAVEPNPRTVDLVRRLRPAFVKLERGWTRDLDSDPARMAQARSLADVVAEIGSALIAEDVGTDAERELLHEIGVRLGQGRVAARPLAALVS